MSLKQIALDLLARLRRAPEAPALPRPLQTPATLPLNMHLYAIGDIHGRLDLLTRLLDLIKADLATLPDGHQSGLIFLGDYIDRGPHSAQVIDCLLADALPCTRPAVFLRGNHEHAFLEFLDNPHQGASWITSYGGREALMSYGVQVPLTRLTPDVLQTLHAQLLAALPPAHRLFLESTRPSYTEGDYLFVHAGVRPDKPLTAQTAWEMMTIREPFLSWPLRLEKMVVHGHSIAEDVARCPHRLGIDTGAYASGILTCAVLEADQCRFIQT